MKFIISSGVLSKQLQAISGIISTSNPLPILDCFLFEIHKVKLNIYASDLETTLCVSMDVDSSDSGKIAIPARILTDTLKTFPNQPLTFSINEKTKAIEISTVSGKYKLTGHDGADFPSFPQLDSPSSFKIEAAHLSTAINKTFFAIGNDELRPVMCGVYFHIEGKNLTFVSTDAHKLVKYQRTDSKVSKPVSYIVPKKPLSIIKNLLAEGQVSIEYNNTNVSFEFGNFHVVSRLIEGKYPNYDAVIPKDHANKLTIDKSLLQGSLRRVSVYCNKNSSLICFSLTKSELGISAQDLDFSNEANEKIKCNYKGEPMQIGFNGKSLLDMLENVEGEEIIMELGAPNTAGVIKEENSNLLMLIMPIMLNENNHRD